MASYVIDNDWRYVSLFVCSLSNIANLKMNSACVNNVYPSYLFFANWVIFILQIKEIVYMCQITIMYSANDNVSFTMLSF